MEFASCKTNMNNNNNNRFNNSISTGWLFICYSSDQIRIFCEGRKTGASGGKKKPSRSRLRTNNKFKPHETANTGIELATFSTRSV